MIYDIAVVGDGIAASAALLTITGQELKIVQIAPGPTDDFKIGETLSSNAAKELIQLGVYEAFLQELDLLGGRNFSAWESPFLRQRNTMQLNVHQDYQLDRIQFEDFLRKKAQRNQYDRLFDKVLKANPLTGHWRLITQNGREIGAKFVLDCSGRAAVIARHFAKRERLDKLVAAFTVLEQKTSAVIPTLGTMIEAVSDGWWYSAVLPNNRLIVSYFTDSDLLPLKTNQDISSWEVLLSNSPYTLKRIKTADFELKGILKVVDAATILTTNLYSPGLLAAGDAMVSFDPLSSHGMTTALWSGRKAALGILGLLKDDDAPLREYLQQLEEGVERYLQQKRSMYGMVKHFEGKHFWERRTTESGIRNREQGSE